MIITAITKQKRHNRYDIFVEGQIYCSLSDMGVIKCGLKVGTQLTSRIEELITQAKLSDALDYLFDVLGRTALTEASARRKLSERGYDSTEIEYSIGKACEYGYINDCQYASAYISANSDRSKARLKNELCFVRGIDSAVVEELLADYNEENACITALSKATKQAPNADERRRLTQRLGRQGFGYDAVNAAINDLFGSEDND